MGSRKMAVGYRALLRLDHDVDAVTLAEQQLRSWFHEKRTGRWSTLEGTSWEGAGVHRLGPAAELHVVHSDHPSDRSRRRLYRFVEVNDTGRWIVSLYAAALPAAKQYPQTIVVEVSNESLGAEQALMTVSPPRIVSRLLDTTRVTDGSTLLTGEPMVIRRGDTQIVLDAIADPERTASVIVAGSVSAEADGEWHKVVASLTKESVGVAASFVVFADAMEELAEALPSSHSVERGRVRTFLPNVVLGDAQDAVRHKWLGPRTLERSLSERLLVAQPLRRRHAELARRRVVEMELPSDVRRMMELLRRAEMEVERAARVAAHIASAEEAGRSNAGVFELSLERETAATRVTDRDENWIGSAKAILKRWLKIPSPRPDDFAALDAFIMSKVTEVQVAAEQLTEAANAEEAVGRELEALRRRLDDRELDLAEAEEGSLAAQRQLTILRQRIAVSSRPQDSFVELQDAEEWEAPVSIEELVARISVDAPKAHAVAERVIFTGDESSALEIDRRYPSGLYAPTLWQYVRVLFDYAELRASGAFRGNVHMYLTSDRVAGMKCSTERHASNESETVLSNAKWREERVFPVPLSVSPSGKALMAAHFRPTHRDTFAPRMHYLDDVSKTGKVYVGYIGKHLTNKQT